MASPLIMHSKSEQQDKQSDNSPLLSVQGEASQSCRLQRRSKGHKTVPFPIIICLKNPHGQVKQSELTLQILENVKSTKFVNLKRKC